MWKPGQLVTIGRTVYRITHKTHERKCTTCVRENQCTPCVTQGDWKYGVCINYIPKDCYPKIVRPKSQEG